MLTSMSFAMPSTANIRQTAPGMTSRGGRKTGEILIPWTRMLQITATIVNGRKPRRNCVGQRRRVASREELATLIDFCELPGIQLLPEQVKDLMFHLEETLQVAGQVCPR